MTVQIKEAEAIKARPFNIQGSLGSILCKNPPDTVAKNDPISPICEAPVTNLRQLVDFLSNFNLSKNKASSAPDTNDNPIVSIACPIKN